MKKSIFLTIATLFLAVCTTSLGYSNTAQQTNTIQPDSTKFTIGIIYDEDFSKYVPQIKELVKWTHWDVIVANQESLTLAKKVLENSNITIIATHGGYNESNGKHTLRLGGEPKDATSFNNDTTIKVKEGAIIFAAACETVSGRNLEEINEFPLVFINKGASMYFGYNVQVHNKVAYDSFAYYLNALIAGKSIQEAKEDRPWRPYATYDITDPDTEHVPLLIFPDNKDYRIPPSNFPPGFIAGREFMTASLNNDNHAISDAIEQLIADIKLFQNKYGKDSKEGKSYIENLKNGMKSVIVYLAAIEKEEIEDADIDKAIDKLWDELSFVIALGTQEKR